MDTPKDLPSSNNDAEASTVSAPELGVAPGSTFERWADYDPDYRGNNRLNIYATKADQRANRPDLKPFKVKITVL